MIGGSKKLKFMLVYECFINTSNLSLKPVIHICYTGSYTISWYVKTNIKLIYGWL